jgi:PHP family Zn ribbon phosphoesterase
MFDAGIDHLMEALPQFEGLGPGEIRRHLSKAFADIVAIRDLDGQAQIEHLDKLQLLATALELEAVFSEDLQAESASACAFVAAEALELVRDLGVLTGSADCRRRLNTGPPAPV